MLGHDARAVETGEDAIELLQSETADLILMDWNLPGISGLETAMSIREQELVSNSVPIIAMTANVLAGDRDACLAAGMNDHLGKPVVLSDMRLMLDRWLDNGPTDVTAGACEESEESVQSAIAGLVEDLGDVATVHVVMKTYLAELEARTEVLLNPDVAALDDARRAAHTLRSTSALLGADKLARLCLHFETCLLYTSPSPRDS